MIVDPSLARGLRQAFWKHTSEQAVQTQQALAEVVTRHKPNVPFSQKGFRRFASDLIQLIPALAGDNYLDRSTTTILTG